MKKPEDKLICQFCKQPIEDSYTTIELADNYKYVLCAKCVKDLHNLLESLEDD